MRQAILAMLGIALMTSPLSAAETLRFTIRVDLGHFAFLDPIDGGSQAGEPLVQAMTSGSPPITTCGGLQNVESGECDASFVFTLTTLLPYFDLLFYDQDPAPDEDDLVDISEGDSGPPVHITIDIGQAEWDSDESVFLFGCHNVDFGDWCTLGGDSGQEDPPDGSLRIRVVRIG